MNSLKDNLEKVKNNIYTAAHAAGRSDNEVTLIAVSKTKPVEMIREVYELGVRDFGENKVQELIAKVDVLPNDIRWHLIGHLQTNKVKYIVDKVYMIHSVDSIKLAQEIDKQAKKHDIIVNCLIEVNVADEDSKFGVKCEDVLSLVEEASKLENIRVRGLMTVAPYVDDPDENIPVFSKLKQLFIDIKQKNIHNVSMDFMSMGMSNDYMVAIQEGATYIRVGTSIFGERDYGLVP